MPKVVELSEIAVAIECVKNASSCWSKGKPPKLSRLRFKSSMSEFANHCPGLDNN